MEASLAASALASALASPSVAGAADGTVAS
jgi:hypothetical protein